MFGGSKKTNDSTDEEHGVTNNILSLRGQLVASNRFRGWIILVLLLCSVAQAVSVMYLVQQERLIVGIDSAGRPQKLEETSATPDLNLFVRDFVSCFLNYSPVSVTKNMEKAKSLMSEQLQASTVVVLGNNFPSQVMEKGIIQLTSVADVKIGDITDNGFIAVVQAGRIKNDSVVQQTVEQKMLINIKVVRGRVTRNNGWGWYVDDIDEKVVSSF